MKRESKTALLWKFFSLTFLLTWICWIPAGILSQKGPHVYVTVLHYAGGIMPMLSALILLRLRGSHEEIKSYFWRLIDFRRIRGSGYALTLLTIPVLTGIGVGIDVLLGGQGAEPEYAATLANAPLALIPFIFATLVFGPLPEEMA